MKAENELKVICVCKVGSRSQSDLLGTRKVELLPVGMVHLFELHSEEVAQGKLIWVRGGLSLCGISGSDIGELVKEYQRLPKGLSVCPVCEREYKAHPRSPWLAWQKSIEEVPGE